MLNTLELFNPIHRAEHVDDGQRMHDGAVLGDYEIGLASSDLV